MLYVTLRGAFRIMHTSVSTTFGKAARLIAALSALALAGAAQTPTLTTLYSFTGSTGANPTAGVVFGANGSIFGTTPYGGSGTACPGGCGTVFELTPGTPWTETVLYNFQGGSDGANPGAALTAGTNGVFYGTTFAGGATGNGTVFQVKAPTKVGGPWTETVLYSFQAIATGSVNVNGETVTLASGSPFVTGTTWNGLAVTINGCSKTGCTNGTYTIASVESSTVMTLTTSTGNPQTGVNYWEGSAAAGPWLGWPDGNNPGGGVVVLPSGSLYGTTTGGGSAGAGTVFQLAPPTGGTGPWTEEIIWNVAGGKFGSGPQSGLVVTKGSLYGTTCCGQVGGTVFKLSPVTGQPWQETTLYTFTSETAGDGPFGGLAMNATTGVLYGTTTGGGPGGGGIVFSLTPGGTGKPYTLATIHAFTSGTAAGTVNVSGTAVTWEAGSSFVTGAAWIGASIEIQGTSYTIKSVTSSTALTLTASAGTQTGVGYLVNTAGEGGAPYGGVLLGTSGQLYVTVTTGGTLGAGAVLEFTPPVTKGEPWTETILYSFTGASDGSEPFAGVVLNNGSLYGTTSFDGASGYGTVYELTP
jgi:uncharacterized repeat protein (TIGR03803 family)